MRIRVLHDQAAHALWIVHRDAKPNRRAIVMQVDKALAYVQMLEQLAHRRRQRIERRVRERIGSPKGRQVRRDHVRHIGQALDDIAKRARRARKAVDEQHRRTALITTRYERQARAACELERRPRGCE
jgi:hypothetical protein